MKASVVPIGNSKGIRIPKAVLEQCRIGSEVDMQVKNGSLVITPAKLPREGWNAAFASMHALGEDTLLIPSVLREEAAGWEW